MYNLLIADDNLIYVKALANEILSKINFVRLVKIATDGEEVYTYLKNRRYRFNIVRFKNAKIFWD